MQEDQKLLVDRLHQAQNILVTVSRNPSVDQLSAAIGLTLALNHLGKHGTAVFSGQIPSTLEFLRPEETLEKNTDSLRDFIIALDKSKADKLRYKVENDVVRIFITPYKTSISEQDLDFSQGDFNVDVVVTLGVQESQDLDEAITAHGRILHDATVTSIRTSAGGEIGTINWVNSQASSLSEMVAGLIGALDKKVMDSQIATALLTGIVATTERFRNDLTTPQTMSASAALMAAGANQQLIATELEQTVTPETSQSVQSQPNVPDQAQTQNSTELEPPKPEPGTLEIDHDGEETQHEAEPQEESGPDLSVTVEPEAPDLRPQIQVDENGQLINEAQHESLPPIGTVRGVSASGDTTESHQPQEPKLEDHELQQDHTRITEQPANFGNLTANSQPEQLDPGSDELSMPNSRTPVMSHDSPMFTSMTDGSVVSSPERVVPDQSSEPALTLPAPFEPPQPLSSQSEPAYSLPNTMVQPAPESWSGDNPATIVEPDDTLTEIEKAVDSPHLKILDTAPAQDNGVGDARSAVDAAFQSSLEPPKPAQAIGASTVFDQAEEQFATPVPTQPAGQPYYPPAPTFSQSSNPTPVLESPAPFPPTPIAPPTQYSGPINPGSEAPPAVPPPMVPPMPPAR
jgi:hypothetical protein